MDLIIKDALASSGLIFASEADANSAGFFEFTSDHATAMGFKTFGHGLLIKYPNLDGSLNDPGFGRVRYTTPLESYKSKRPIRYLQPKDSRPQLYFPNCNHNWLTVAANPGTSIIITEGEKKAYASQLMLDIPTIGLGGVTSFAHRKLDCQPLLPEFSLVDFKARKVYIAYDSDIESNTNVERAELVLAEALADLGAEVWFVRLPPNPMGEKQGLDDALVNDGVAMVKTYLADAEPYLTAKALASFGKTCWFVRNQGVYIDLATEQLVDPKRGLLSYYANRHYLKTVLDKKGATTVVKANLFKDYNAWPARNEFASVINEPGAPKISDSLDYNLWSDTSVPAVQGDVTAYLEFCKYFFSMDAQMEQWWHDWAATIIQQPGAKMQTAWLLYSEQTGNGKTLMARILGHILGKSYIEGHEELISDDRYDWIVGKQLALIDDLNDYVSRGDGAKIRALITRNIVSINPKFMARYEVTDHVNYIITTNEEVSVKINHTDRRFFVMEAPNDRAPDELYATLYAMLKDKAKLGAIKQWYLDYKISDGFTSATRPPSGTTALEQAKEAGEDHFTSFAKATVTDSGLIPDGITLMTGQELMELYNAHQVVQGYKQVTSYRTSLVGIRLKKMGYRMQGYPTGITTKQGVKTFYWVGKYASELKETHPTSVELLEIHERETPARLAALMNVSASKF